MSANPNAAPVAPAPAKSKKLIVIVAIVAVLAIVAAAAYVLMMQRVRGEIGPWSALAISSAAGIPILLGAAVAGSIEQAAEQADLTRAVLGDQQVLQRGHVLEQTHVLEGAHHAVVGHLMAALARNALATQDDRAAGGLVETADAVEHRGLARTVGADDGKHFLWPDVEPDMVHSQQAAKAHAQVFDF